MKTLEIKDATESLADYARDMDMEIVIVTRNGKPVAALVSLENVDEETLNLSSNPDFIELIERSRKEHKSKGGLSSKELQRRLS
jgi:PHD/YefM family antitoxin component YafN of YafNO toxin-antitoxin module